LESRLQSKLIGYCRVSTEETLRRVSVFVELHVEQGRGLIDLDRPVAVGSVIWPHGRWRLDLFGKANHDGTTRLVDRHDPMLALAAVIGAARATAQQRGCVATIGKLAVEPNGINAIPSQVTAWLDARGPAESDVGAVAAAVAAAGGLAAAEGLFTEESFTGDTAFDRDCDLHGKWFWLKFREADGWVSAAEIDTRSGEERSHRLRGGGMTGRCRWAALGP